MANPEYIDAICPECGGPFHYIRCGFRPMTCNRKECVWDHAHPEIKKFRRERDARLDQIRKASMPTHRDRRM